MGRAATVPVVAQPRIRPPIKEELGRVALRNCGIGPVRRGVRLERRARRRNATTSNTILRAELMRTLRR